MIVKASSFEALWHFITISNILPLQALTTHGWKITQVSAYSFILDACTWDLSTYSLILHILRMKVCSLADVQEKLFFIPVLTLTKRSPFSIRFAKGIWCNKFCFCDLGIMLGQIETLLRVYCHFAKMLSKPIAYEAEWQSFQFLWLLPPVFF